MCTAAMSRLRSRLRRPAVPAPVAAEASAAAAAAAAEVGLSDAACAPVADAETGEVAVGELDDPCCGGEEVEACIVL